MSSSLEEENARLRKELAAAQAAKSTADQVRQKEAELESMRSNMVKLSRQLDEEKTLKDYIEANNHHLERKLYDLEYGSVAPGSSVVPASKSGKGISFGSDRSKEEGGENPLRDSQVSVKLMRVVEQWMSTKDLQQALLRNAGINDVSFSTLVQVLSECGSLSMLDLGQNQLTMDSCSDICRLITTAPKLSFVSVAENHFSMRSIGYFMTAVMERQNKKKLTPLEVLDLEGNEGLIHAIGGAQQQALVDQVSEVYGDRLPNTGAELVAQVMRALWRFLHYTDHPQVKDTSEDEVDFQKMDRATLRKMENALCKLLLMSEDSEGGVGAEGHPSNPKTVHANLVLLSLQEPADTLTDGPVAVTMQAAQGGGYPQEAKANAEGVHLPPIEQQGASASGKRESGMAGGGSRLESTQRPPRMELRDPFSDLKTAFEPPKEKLKTFNHKQIVTKSGQVLMNMLERLLETTEIDARDVETDQTLLEYACQTGNMGLAKLCYRRGANLSARTKRGASYLNIVTKNKRYDLMEFLHTYGVKVNHQDAEGRTALHVAAAENDVDAICRLLEWGADVNLHDHKKRTPLHTAARNGHNEATMLLLEVGADMNAKDEKEYTAVAHAEAMNHFALMDRLTELGGKGHGLSMAKKDPMAKTAKNLGELTVTAGMLKSSSLGRIGKVAVKGMPPQLAASLLK